MPSTSTSTDKETSTSTGKTTSTPTGKATSTSTVKATSTTSTSGSSQTAVAFTYPTPLSSGQLYQFTSRDTLNVTWTTPGKNYTATTLQLWFWSPNFSDDNFRAFGYNTQVANSGLSVSALSVVQSQGAAYYLGQWHLYYNGNLTVSPYFNCTFNATAPALTYGKSAKADPAVITGYPPTGSSTSAPSSAASSSSVGALQSHSPSAGQSSLSGGAIAGIVIAVVVVLSALAGFFLLRRRKQRKSQGISINTRWGNEIPPAGDEIRREQEPFKQPSSPQLLESVPGGANSFTEVSELPAQLAGESRRSRAMAPQELSTERW